MPRSTASYQRRLNHGFDGLLDPEFDTAEEAVLDSLEEYSVYTESKIMARYTCECCDEPFTPERVDHLGWCPACEADFATHTASMADPVMDALEQLYS